MANGNIVTLPADALKQNSDWADTFSGGTTNAALRTSHSQDQSAYAQALQQQQQEHMDNLIATDKNAFAIHKGQQELDMQRETHNANMLAAQQKLQSDAELHPLKIAQMQAETAASSAAEKARTQTALLQAKAAQQKDEDTAGLAEHINQAIESGARPGTREFQDYVLKGITTFPNADPKIQQDIISQAKINQTPDEVLAQWNTLPDELKKDARFTIGSDGKASIVSGTTHALTTNAQLTGYNQQITQARGQQKAIDAQIKNSMDDGEIATLKSKRDALDGVIDQATEAHSQLVNGVNPAANNTVMFAQPTGTPQQPAAAPTAVPDLRALATQALNDPAATPEHKAAAQRILAVPATVSPPASDAATNTIDSTKIFPDVAAPDQATNP